MNPRYVINLVIFSYMNWFEQESVSEKIYRLPFTNLTEICVDRIASEPVVFNLGSRPLLGSFAMFLGSQELLIKVFIITSRFYIS